MKPGLSKIPPAAAAKLGHYVYLYVNPLDDTVFYVGKGKGNRALAHLDGKSIKKVKEKFGGHPEAAADLARLEKDPESPGGKAVVQQQLARFIQDDPEFGRELELLVKAARTSGGDEIIQTVIVSHGTAGDITQIGKVTGN